MRLSRRVSAAVRASGFYRFDDGFIDSIGNNPIPSLTDPANNAKLLEALAEVPVDKVEVGDVQRFEQGLREHVRSRFGDVLDTIRDTGRIGDDDRFQEAIRSYGDVFGAEGEEG